MKMEVSYTLMDCIKLMLAKNEASLLAKAIRSGQNEVATNVKQTLEDYVLGVRT